MEIVVNKLAYCKMILHMAKYPYSSCNGVLLSKKQNDNENNNRLEISDSFPLFHASITLNPGLEIALLHVILFSLNRKKTLISR